MDKSGDEAERLRSIPWTAFCAEFPSTAVEINPVTSSSGVQVPSVVVSRLSVKSGRKRKASAPKAAAEDEEELSPGSKPRALPSSPAKREVLDRIKASIRMDLDARKRSRTMVPLAPPSSSLSYRLGETKEAFSVLGSKIAFCFADNGDLPKLLGERQNVQLAIVDPPYGQGVASWDSNAWTKLEFRSALLTVAACTTAPAFTVAFFVHPNQYGQVTAAVEDASRVLVSSFSRVDQAYGAWFKDMGRSISGPNVPSGYEQIAFVFVGGLDSVVKNFPPTGRSLIFSEPAVAKRLVATDGKTIVNPAEKPPGLARKLIDTFSEPGSTVLGLCGGLAFVSTGAIGSGRSVVETERELDQFTYGRNRLVEQASNLGESVSLQSSASASSRVIERSKWTPHQRDAVSTCSMLFVSLWFSFT